MHRFVLSAAGLLILSLGLRSWFPEHLQYFSHAGEIGVAFVGTLYFWFLYMALGFCLGLSKERNEPLQVTTSSIFKECLVSTALGMGIYSAAILLFGIFVGVSNTKIFIFHGILTVVAMKGWKSLSNHLRDIARRIQRRRWTFQETAGMFVLGAILLSFLPFSMTPAIFPDTLRYHFGLTKLYQDAGRIIYFPDIAESNISSNWQMLFMGQLLMFGPTCAQLFNWSALLVLTVAVVICVQPSGRFWAAAFVISFPFLLATTSITNNDIGVTLFAAMMLLVARDQTYKNRWLIAGVMGGIGAGVKYSYLLYLFAFAVAVFMLVEKESAATRVKIVLTLACGALIGYSPWFIRNLCWTGDPLYPALSSILPWSNDFGKHVTQTYARELAYYGGGMQGIQRWALGLWRATTENSHYFESDFGFVVITLVPMLVWNAFRKGGNKLESLSFLLFIALWSAGPQVTRFVSVAVPAFAIAASEGFIELGKGLSGKVFKFVLILLIAMNISLAWLALGNFSNPYGYFIKGESRNDYLLQYTPTFPTAHWLSQFGHADAKVLLIGVEDINFFTNPIQYSGPFDEKWIVRKAAEANSPEDLANRVKESGINLIYVDRKQTEALEKKFGYFSWPNEQTKENFFRFFNRYTFLIKKDEVSGTIRELREVISPSPLPDKTP